MFRSFDVVREFNLDERFTHLAGFWLSSHPRCVREAIEKFRIELDSNPFVYLSENEARLDEDVRKALARFIGATSTDEIILVGSATEGLSVIFGGMRLEFGEEIICTEHEHYSSWQCLRYLTARTGAPIRSIALYNDGAEVQEEELCGKVVSAIGATTRVLALTAVHSNTGVLLPIRMICESVRRINVSRSHKDRIRVIVDGTHAFGAMPVNVAKLGCDVFVASCHKWLCGPRGTGFAWANNDILQELHPIIPSFGKYEISLFTRHAADAKSRLCERLTPGGFHCYEHRWAVAAAVNFIEDLGIDDIDAYVCHLAMKLKTFLREIKGVTVITPHAPACSAGLVSFSVEGCDPVFVTTYLLTNKISASVSPYRNRYVRLSPSILNSEADIIKVVECLERLCKRYVGHSLQPSQ